MKRRKAPVLTFGEKWVRRRAAIGTGDENVLLAPGVEALSVHSERQIEIKQRIVLVKFRSELIDLLLCAKLRVKMVAFDFGGVVACREFSKLQPLWLIGPAGFLLFRDRAETRVVVDFGSAAEKAFDLATSLEFLPAEKIG